MHDWFTGTPGSTPPTKPIEINSIDRDRLFGADNYDAEPGSRDAVNTALLLDQALVVTGEPGTGKTQLAEKVALELGFPLFRFETKSSSIAQDLFYTIDHVARFQAAQVKIDGNSLDIRRFIDYGPLGRAILQSMEPDAVKRYFFGSTPPDWYSGPSRSVVLIDEIDKAPIEFTNDLLNEIERHYFRIRELDHGEEAKASRLLRPFVLVTSNSERQLPDAFLRRCIFYHFPPITPERLQAIALRRLHGIGVRDGQMLKSALQLFERLRSDELDLRKRPSTPEFLSFLSILQRNTDVRSDRPIPNQAALQALSTLVKAPEDQELARKLLSEL